MAAYPTPSPLTFNVQDSTLSTSVALPAGASTTVNGTAIDLGTLSGISSRTERVEVLASIPALTTTMVPDTKTMTLTIQAGATTAFSTPITIGSLVLTGASSAGTAASTIRVKLPSNCPRYIRLVSVSGANVTDCSSLKQTLQLVF